MRLLASAMVATVLLTASLPAMGFHSSLPSLYTTTVTGNGAWGLRVDSTDGNWALDLNANAPQAASQMSGGVFFFNAAKQLQFGFAFTAHTSPNRLIVDTTGVTGDAAAIPLGVTWRIDTPDTDASCNLLCLGLTGSGAGTSYYVAWVGGGATTTLDVLGTGSTRVTASAGSSYVLGDPEILTGAPNVQVQQGAGGVIAGVKIMKDASASIQVANNLYGFFGASDFKLVCQFLVGACLWKSTLDYTYAPVCTSLTGVSCWTTQISAKGPSGTQTGSQIYAFLGSGAGAYAFNVDLKVDPYGPSVYDSVSGTWVFLGENYSYVSVADAALPA